MPVLGSSDILLKIASSFDDKGVKQADGGLDKLSRLAGGVQDTAQKLTGVLLGAGVAVGGLGIMGVRTAGDMEAARQGFVALLGSAEEADATMARIKREAAATPFELPGLTAGAQALTAITKDGDAAVDMLLDVGKAIATSGKGQAEFDRVIGNLQQIASTGVVTEMDIRQFQNAIPIFNDIIEAAGLTTDELKNADNAAELLQDAFAKAGREGGIAAGGFAAQAGTFNQLWSNLMDTVNIQLSEFVEKSGIFDLVKEGLEALIPFVERFGNFMADTAVPALKDFFSEKENVIGFLTAMAVLFAIVAAPIILAAAKIALLGLALVALGVLVSKAYGLWEDNFMGIQDIVSGVLDFFTNTLWPGVRNTFDSMVDKVMWVKDNFWEAVGFIIGFFASLPFKLPMYIGLALGKVVELLLNVNWGRLFGRVIDANAQAWGKVIGFIKNINWWNVLDGIKAAFTGILKGMVSGIPGASEALGALGIPGFENGVTNFKGGLAYVHQGEVLTNLPRGTNVIPAEQVRQGIGGRGVTIENFVMEIHDSADMAFNMDRLERNISARLG